jgi:hypothetical protein
VNVRKILCFVLGHVYSVVDREYGWEFWVDGVRMVGVAETTRSAGSCYRCGFNPQRRREERKWRKYRERQEKIQARRLQRSRLD